MLSNNSFNGYSHLSNLAYDTTDRCHLDWIIKHVLLVASNQGGCAHSSVQLCVVVIENGAGGGKVTNHVYKRGVVAIKVGQDAVYYEGAYRGISLNTINFRAHDRTIIYLPCPLLSRDLRPSSDPFH